MRRFSKQAKSAMAATLAVVLAVPAVSLFTSSSPVRAEEYPADLPMPIKVYDFETNEGLTISSVTNPAVIENDEERGSKVVKLQDAVTVEIASGTGTWVDYNINSSIQIENPFVGREDVYERDPAGFRKAENDENENGAPIWEKGVTISYWQKTSGKGEESESSVLAFNSYDENAVQADDLDKVRIAELYKENPDDPIFYLGELRTIQPSEWATFKHPLDGKGTEGVLRAARECYFEFGLLAPFNPNYKKRYYLQLNDAGTLYKTPVEMSGHEVNVNAYMTLTGPATKVKTYYEEGSLSFKSSGAWGFFESGITADYYVNGVFDSHVNASPARNHAIAYTYTSPENSKEKTYEPVAGLDEPLIDNSEWHYMTYVVQNDHVNLYVDGVLQDELFTNGSTSWAVDSNKRFNRGWGYYDSVAGIINKQGGMDIFKFSNAIATPMNGKFDLQYDENGDYMLGYNGNTNQKTIMETLTDENTTLWIGEDGNSTNALKYEEGKGITGYWYHLNYGTKTGTMIDDLAFFAEPMSEEQVETLYKYVSAGNTPVEPPSDTSEPPTGSAQPIESGAPTQNPGTNKPIATETAVPTQDPGVNTPDPTETTNPTQPPKTALMGDVDFNGSCNLEDAYKVLNAALGITGAELTGDAFKVADVDNNGKITLEDANKVLKLALAIDKAETIILAAKLGL